MKYLVNILFLLPLCLWATDYNVREYGATGVKGEICTEALQGAIDACYKAGGGRVYLPPGAYTSGTIVLKDHVTFYLESGATLYASHDIKDYRMPLQDVVRPVLIYSNGAHDIAIKGQGSINGEAKREYLPLKGVDRFIKEITANAMEAGVEEKMYYIVPPNVSLTMLTRSKDITIEGVSFIESTFWTLHLLHCERVMIRGLRVQSSLESGVNADGIDINNCRYVTVSDCIVQTGDDAIVIKTWDKESSEYITISNCVLSSSSTGLKIGTETKGNVRHVLFQNCSVSNTNRGLSIVVRDGGHVSDILFSDITVSCNRRHFNWWGNGDPIWIILTQSHAKSAIGSIENVVFDNVIIRGRGTSRIESLLGPGLVRNITLRNVQLQMQEEDYLDKRADHAIYAYDIDGLAFENVKVDWDSDKTEPKWGSAFYLEKIRELQMDRVRARQGLVGSELPVIQLKEVEGARLSEVEGLKGASTLLHVEGGSSRDLFVKELDMRGYAKEKIKLAPEVNPKVILPELPK